MFPGSFRFTEHYEKYFGVVEQEVSMIARDFFLRFFGVNRTCIFENFQKSRAHLMRFWVSSFLAVRACATTHRPLTLSSPMCSEVILFRKKVFGNGVGDRFRIVWHAVFSKNVSKFWSLASQFWAQNPWGWQGMWRVWD